MTYEIKRDSTVLIHKTGGFSGIDTAGYPVSLDLDALPDDAFATVSDLLGKIQTGAYTDYESASPGYDVTVQIGDKGTTPARLTMIFSSNWSRKGIPAEVNRLTGTLRRATRDLSP